MYVKLYRTRSAFYGLARKTGYTITISFIYYNKSTTKKHSLTGSDIQNIIISKNSLWAINSFGGLNEIDLITGDVIYSWHQQTNDSLSDVLLSSLAIYGDNLYLGGSTGLYKFSLQTRAITKIILYDVGNSGIPKNPNITKLGIDHKQCLWLFLANYGPVIMSIPGQKILSYNKADPSIVYSFIFTDDKVITGTTKGVKQYKLIGNSVVSSWAASIIQRFSK